MEVFTDRNLHMKMTGYKSREKKTEKEWTSPEVIALFVIMMICMSASILSCIVSIRRISTENSQSDSMILAHMVENDIESEFIKPIVVTETMSNDYSLKEYMKKSGNASPEVVETRVASYLDSIRDGFDYQMVYVICDRSRAYYTYDGLCKLLDVENDPSDIWYQHFLDSNRSYKLEVDTDETNQWALSVFVNQEIIGENREFLGVCGVGIEMKELQMRLKWYEIKYNLKIDLIDKNGLIQVDSDTARIQREYIELPYLSRVGAEDFYYESAAGSSRMTKYLKDLGWYLVVEDLNPEKINVFKITIMSIIIFVIGLLLVVIVFAASFMRERRASKELIERKKISITDEMTGLLNRRAYEEDCIRLLETGAVDRMTVIMMDVNGLKTVNDTYGHQAGDKLLIGAAKCIQTAMGEYGNVYRTGGDEFVALLECTKEQLDDLLRTLEHIINRQKEAYQCGFSISKGIVVCGEHEDLTFGEMKELADKLMYEDKDEYYRRTGKKRRKA